jgi:preprotein translocase subunit SecF
MFFQQAQLALIMAFVFMAIVVFILFRSLVPSSIVLLCAATDIIITIAVLNVLGVTLSLPIIVALLTIIGYSVDTDILLTSELLKSGAHNASTSIKRAMKTGITMSCTTLVALFALYFISGSIVLEQIAFALIIGIMVDIPATWLTNTGILRSWLEKKWKK